MVATRSPEAIEKQKATIAANKRRSGKKRSGKKKRGAKKKSRALQRPARSKPGSDLDRCIEQLGEAQEGLRALKQSLKEVFGYE